MDESIRDETARPLVEDRRSSNAADALDITTIYHSGQQGRIERDDHLLSLTCKQRVVSFIVHVLQSPITCALSTLSLALSEWPLAVKIILWCIIAVSFVFGVLMRVYVWLRSAIRSALKARVPDTPPAPSRPETLTHDTFPREQSL